MLRCYILIYIYKGTVGLLLGKLISKVIKNVDTSSKGRVSFSLTWRASVVKRNVFLRSLITFLPDSGLGGKRESQRVDIWLVNRLTETD